MQPDAEATRQRMLALLDQTQHETRALLASLDPERVIHTDERAWRVRDILGHLGVWNTEAARSLRAWLEGGEYHCIPTEALYHDYNGPAAEERKTWTLEQVWEEYDAAHAELRQLITSIPAGKWDAEMTYPWNERGGIERLIRVMMAHEKVDHCDLAARTVH